MQRAQSAVLNHKFLTGDTGPSRRGRCDLVQCDSKSQPPHSALEFIFVLIADMKLQGKFVYTCI